MDDVIVSKHGKSIQVEKTVVVKAEKIMKQGQVCLLILLYLPFLIPSRRCIRNSKKSCPWSRLL